MLSEHTESVFPVAVCLHTPFTTARAKWYTGHQIYFNNQMLQPIGHVAMDDS